MRLVCCASSLLSARSTSADSSTLQAMTFHYVLQGDGPLLAGTDALQHTFGKVHVLEILEVLKQGFANIVGLRSSGTPRQPLQAFFNGLWKSNRQHHHLA